MQTVAWIWGIAHPTGFPAFVLGGYAFAHLVPIGLVAWRLALFSALAMALGSSALFAAAREINLAPVTALCVAWTFASTELAWTRGTRTEVHALALACSALSLWLGLRFLRTRQLRLLPFWALSLSVSLGVHPVGIFIVPLFFAWIALRMFQERSHPLFVRAFQAQAKRVLGGCLLAASICPLLYLSLPVRSAWVSAVHADPTLKLGLPAGRPYWDYDHPISLSGFQREITGSDFNVSGGFHGLLRPSTYANIPTVFFADLNQALGGYDVLFILVVGAVALTIRIGKPETACLLLCGFLAVPFAASYTSESDVARYFLIAYWLAVLLFGLGLETLAKFLHPRLRQILPPILLLLLVRAHIQTIWPQLQFQHEDHRARQFIKRVIHVTPKNAIIIAAWGEATPLAYAAYVDRSMQRRIVETAWAAEDAPYFAHWRKYRPIVLVSPDGQVPPNVRRFKALDKGYPQLLLIEQLQ